MLTTRPVIGLVAYLGILLIYPDYLRISVGTIDISASRIIVCVLLLRCLVSTPLLRRFRWQLLDTLVVVSMIIYAATLAFTTPFDIWLENRGGFVMDTLFAYLAVRLIVVDRFAFLTMLKALALITLLLAVHAVIESLTGWSLYAGLGKYCPWAPLKGAIHQMRYGLNRAMGPFGNTIMFGLYFATMVPILWLLRHEYRPWNRLCHLATAAAVLGVVATVSSGSYVALAVVLICLGLEHAKHLVRPLLVILILGCVTLEVLSNRHFYDVVLDRTGMDGANAWYRSELFEVAIRKLPEYWTVGYGLRDPGWGPLIDGRNRSDGVNDYVVHTVLYGAFGVAAFVAMLVSAMRSVVRAHRATRNAWIRSCAWSLGSSVTALMVAFFGVSLFGQMVSVLYVVLGLHGAMGAWVAREEAPSTRFVGI